MNIILGGRATPQLVDSIVDMLGEVPIDASEVITISDAPSRNFAIRINTCSGVYMGDQAMELLGAYVKAIRSDRSGYKYAQRDFKRQLGGAYGPTNQQDADALTNEIARKYRTTEFARMHFLVHPFADIDQSGPSLNPLDWKPPYQTYLTNPITEAGGEINPSLAFVPKRIEDHPWKHTYLDARARYSTHW